LFQEALTAHHLTTARFMSSLVSFSTLLLMLVGSVALGFSGVVGAAVSLNVALLSEVLVLLRFGGAGFGGWEFSFSSGKPGVCHVLA
jgi:hypothetical protein